MIDILPAPENVAAYRLSGRITGEDYDGLVADLETRLETHDKLGVYVDLIEFDDMTVEAAFKDLRFGLAKLGDLRRFPREAVVTDKQWVKALTRFADPLLPHVEVRTFAPDRRDEAMAWAAQAR
ncbi:STAS/SEC14 domain-containing protein [Caulobacter sp. 17J65-9]|uniref:STAS/SEC14 domain-containing protein n=1 Tax=Caulobacter sp. 17J65-9 TaxID=2709382 RepID=UPI0013C7EA00|nr:STAS/SEC14 domain-containing protein [Caulobacter sp. 17J65-9]NEX91958.1 STAS/SEC14 domain-containing protein [Caulobacter sp. 17J65-9]